MTKRSFSDRVVVITGGAGGIGRALAARFGRAGARIAALDRDAAGLKDLERELGASGTPCLALECDITQPAQCEAAIAKVRERWGGIDMLINNAGLVHRSSFRDTDVDVFRRVMDVNYFGSLHVTKAALDSLVDRRGSIVVISSIAGLAPLYGRSGYSASKHALHGLFESLRSELSSAGVNVLLVCPSFTRSAFETRALGPDGQRVSHGRSKVGKEATPESVARAVFRAASRNRHALVLSAVGKLAVLLSRAAPGVYARLMARSLAGELETR